LATLVLHPLRPKFSSFAVYQFPPALALRVAIANDDFTLLGDALSPTQIPDVSGDRITWVDGYATFKTTIPAHTIALEPKAKIVNKSAMQFILMAVSRCQRER
jgi:hypothetical protein